MDFLSIREFSSSPRKTRETLKRSGKIVLTNNGKPSMLVFDITGQDFESLIDTLNRAEAMRLLDEIQMQAVRGGLNSMTMDEIDKEIVLHRRRKKPSPPSPKSKGSRPVNK
jgi:hypothetical protein